MINIKRIIAVGLMVLMSNIYANLVLAAVDGSDVFGNLVFGEKEELLPKAQKHYQKDYLKKLMVNSNLRFSMGDNYLNQKKT